MSNLPIFGIDLGRIMASKILGGNPDIEFYVIDLVQGVAVDGPYDRIEVREGRVYLFTKTSWMKLVEEELKKLQDHFNVPRLPPTTLPPQIPRPRPTQPLPRPSQQRRPVLLPQDSVPIDLRKTPEGAWE